MEPTCIWRVDRIGKPQNSDERCQGPKLVFDERYHPTGQGHIQNPKPLPAGMYEEVTDEALAGDLVASLAKRVAMGSVADDFGGNPAVASAMFGMHLRSGLAAISAGDASAVQRAADEAVALRKAHGASLPPAPDERVLRAWLAKEAGNNPRALLAPVFAHYEPEGPVITPRSEAHAVAMWIDLTSRGRARPEDWNERIIPLMNRYKRDPARFRELCDYGEAALADTHQTLEGSMPDCIAARSKN